MNPQIMGHVMVLGFPGPTVGFPGDLKWGSRKKHSITVLTFSVISNSLLELDSEF